MGSVDRTKLLHNSRRDMMPMRLSSICALPSSFHAILHCFVMSGGAIPARTEFALVLDRSVHWQVSFTENPSYTTTLRITLVWSYKRDGRS